MSTRPDATYDDATTTSTRTDTTDFSTRPDDPTTPSADAATSTGDAPTPHGEVSWTDRCKRQFATTDSSRMRNLADDENHAMHDGV